MLKVYNVYSNKLLNLCIVPFQEQEYRVFKYVKTPLYLIMIKFIYFKQ